MIAANRLPSQYERRASGLIAPRAEHDRSGFGRRWRKHCSIMPGVIASEMMIGGGGHDPHWSSVVLQCAFSGADGSTTFSDQSNSAHALTANGSVDIMSNTAVFDGSTAYITAPSSADWQIGSTWTAEFFGVYFDGLLTSNQCLMCAWGPASVDIFRFFYAGSQSPQSLQTSLHNTPGAVEYLSSTFAPSSGARHDICFELDGSGNLRFYVDGALLSKSTSVITPGTYSTSLTIGANFSNTSTYNTFADGRMEAIRLTKGIARYATDTSYTVPSLPLPTH